MNKKILLSILIVVAIFTVTGCEKKDKSKSTESNSDIIKITENDKGYTTTFKTINGKFIQSNPKYNHVDSDDLGIFISFDYIESPKETYDYAKTHNFLGNEYAEGEVKDYKWNNYEGYTYGREENEAYFRILLEDDVDNSIVLSAYVGPKVDAKNKADDIAKIVESDDFQEFLNSIEFKKENK